MTDNKDVEQLRLLGDPLLAWYGANRRILPWREEPTPYRVWISEIMLQQTRVEAGKSYFERFIAQLPQVSDLANVEDQQLMKLWEGLGYYNRARNLKKAAGVVVEKYGGVIPGKYEELLTLPGVGPYTAGAIASIAFGVPVPAVDGNVLRVVSRLLKREEDIARPSVKKQMEEELKEAMPKKAPGDFNQALMELGAVVCIPNGAPKCAQCPVAQGCKARAAGVQQELPVKAAKKARVVQEKTMVILLTADGRMALRRRPETGLLAGLWELPSWEGSLSREQVLKGLSQWGLEGAEIAEAGETKHIFSHIEWRMKGYVVRLGDREAGPEDAQGAEYANPAGRGRGGVLGEEPAVYLKDIEERKKRKCGEQEAELVFADSEQLTGYYALPSAFKGFSRYFPK